RFSRRRVTTAGVEERVRLAIASSMSIQKSVARARILDCTGSSTRDASPPVARSGLSDSFAEVTTLPTRNDRYSSFKVGARNERYAEAASETSGLERNKTESRGLEAVSDRAGNRVSEVIVPADETVVFRPSRSSQASKRTPPVRVQASPAANTSSRKAAPLFSCPPAVWVDAGGPGIASRVSADTCRPSRPMVRACRPSNRVACVDSPSASAGTVWERESRSEERSSAIAEKPWWKRWPLPYARTVQFVSPAVPSAPALASAICASFVWRGVPFWRDSSYTDPRRKMRELFVRRSMVSSPASCRDEALVSTGPRSCGATGI